MIGRVISHYEVLEKLGEGGMGVVYKARDTRLGRFAALKLLPPDKVTDPERRNRFVREARAASALNHPNIVTIYDIDATDGVYFIAMEYISGQTLGALIPSTGIPVREATDYAIQIADALGKAHAAGITHRDLKPANIMLTEDRRVKILDFGLAKLVESEGSAEAVTRSMESRTEEGRIIGTLPYMSPEQAQGQELDHRADIFSLGVVLYQMLTGVLPFRAPHWIAILEQIIQAPMPSPRALRPHLPDAIERIVFRATAKDREDRYQSMSQISADLRSLDTATLEAPPAEVPFLHRRTGLLVLAAVALVVLMAWAFWEPIADMAVRMRLPSRKQIAVLPFVNIGNVSANQLLCDGVLETLSAKLSQFQNFQRSLSVVPASEVREAKLTTAGEARRVFGVNLALTGSLQPIQDAIRVTINLVDAGTRRQLMSRVIDVPASDMTVLQDDVFVQTAAILDLALTQQAKQALSAGETRVSEAYYRYVQARGYLARYDIADNVDRAIPLLQQAVQKDSAYAVARASLGEAYWYKYRLTKERKWAEDAQASCLHAVQLDPHLAGVNVILGMVYRETGQTEKALDALQAALEIDPMSADAHRYLGRTYEDLRKTSEAESTYKRAIALRPDLWYGYWDLAAHYQRRARYDEAAAQFLEVIRLAPDHDRAYNALGGIYYYQKKFDQAEAMFKKSLAIRPTVQAYSNYGALYLLQRRYPEAVLMLKSAIQSGPANRETWNNLAEAYSMTPGHAAEAAAAYRNAAELAEKQLAVNPSDGSVRAGLAGYLAKLGQKREALGQIERARKLAPNDQNVLFRSALIYEMTGNRGRALEALGEAITNGYSSAEIEGASELADLRNDPRYRKLVKDKVSH